MTLLGAVPALAGTAQLQDVLSMERASSVPNIRLLDRQISQQGNRWLVRYQVLYEGDTMLDLSADDFSVAYEAWVSNSSLKPHTTPRKSRMRSVLSATRTLQATVIPSANDRQRCREKLSLACTTGDKPAAEFPLATSAFLPTRVKPGETIWLYLTLEHAHFLHGAYDPLLGERTLEIHFGPCRLIDTIPLNSEQVPARPIVQLSDPPKERLDSRQFHSPPDSLYLAADVPGYQYFRFDEMPVRYGSQFRFTCWYLIAVGTEGSCHARLMEYRDTPNSWERLDTGFDQQLVLQGRWHKFEKIFQTGDETTTIAIDFRICGANVGEMWLDDMTLNSLSEERTEK